MNDAPAILVGLLTVIGTSICSPMIPLELPTVSDVSATTIFAAAKNNRIDNASRCLIHLMIIPLKASVGPSIRTYLCLILLVLLAAKYIANFLF